jgi:ABC-type nitrate/sulfonate/bicarbonate transport system permease component
MTGRTHTKALLLVTSSTPLSTRARIIWTAALLFLWWLVAQSGTVSTLIIPHPLDVATAAANIGWRLLEHVAATLLRTGIGYVFGLFLGVAFGFLAQYSAAAQKVLVPFFDAARPVPAIAVLPVFILLFGFSETGRVLLIALSTGVFIATATIEAIAKIPEPWTRFARVSGLSRAGIYREVLTWGCIPFLLGPSRLALALAFTLTIAAEFMGAQSGLGYLINTARVNLAIPTVWLAILLIGIISLAFDMVVVQSFRKATDWYRGAEKLGA